MRTCGRVPRLLKWLAVGERRERGLALALACLAGAGLGLPGVSNNS